jgi:hypothetical protein
MTLDPGLGNPEDVSVPLADAVAVDGEEAVS